MKKIFRPLSLCLPILFLTSCTFLPGNTQSQPLQSVDTAMGTVIQQNIYGNTTNNETITDDILSEITDLEEHLLSRRLESAEIYQVNQEAKASGEAKTSSKALASTKSIAISDQLASILATCERWKKILRGRWTLP